MELVLIAVVALIILAGVDADLWPHPVPKARRSRRVVSYPRRTPARSFARRERYVPRPALRYAGSSTRLCSVPRWWWE